MWRGIIGRGFDLDEFQAYIGAIQFTGWRPAFVVVHNTSEPTQALYEQWQTRPGWTGEQWLRNLQSYYSGMGWPSGPHAFVAKDKIWGFTPFTAPGTHSPAWNARTWGIETVGEFMHEPFDGSVRDNLVGALAVLHCALGLDPADYHFATRGLHFHKEDPVTTHKQCPGVNMNKGELVAAVVAKMQEMHPGDHQDVPARVHAADTTGMTFSELNSVTWLQQSLNAIGNHLDVDGAAGPATKAAVKAFQAKCGLTVDGIAGPLTRAALKQAASA
jgi:hypothetical protein